MRTKQESSLARTRSLSGCEWQTWSLQPRMLSLPGSKQGAVSMATLETQSYPPAGGILNKKHLISSEIRCFLLSMICRLSRRLVPMPPRSDRGLLEPVSLLLKAAEEPHEILIAGKGPGLITCNFMKGCNPVLAAEPDGIASLLHSSSYERTVCLREFRAYPIEPLSAAVKSSAQRYVSRSTA